MADQPKPEITETQTRFEYGSFAPLTLQRSAADLLQSDAEAWMQAFVASKRGNTRPEYDGKVVEAAIVAGWIASPIMAVDTDGTILVGDRAARVGEIRFYARCIDAVYGLATNPPAK